MKNITLSLTLTFGFLFTTLTAFSQEGKQFPELRGVTLDNKSVTLPQDTKGGYTLVGLAFTQKSQEALETWAEPVYYEFIDPSDFTAMVYDDVKLYLTLMFTGLKQSMSDKAIKKIKEGTDEDLKPHVLVYEGKMGEYDDFLEFKKKDRDIPRFYVLDKEGKIVYATSGVYSEDKMDKISDLVEAD